MQKFSEYEKEVAKGEREKDGKKGIKEREKEGERDKEDERTNLKECKRKREKMIRCGKN